MKIVLAGTRSFGAAALEAIHQQHDVVLTLSPHGDRVNGTANRLGVRWAQEASAGLVRDCGADLVVCAHSHLFVGKKTRQATTLGAIGYHPSLLPRHRGRDAVRWTIAMGDPVAGGSVYWLTDHVDGGPIAAQDWCFVRKNDDAHSLWRDRLFPMGIDLLLKVLHDLDNGRIVQQKQDEAVATWEPSWDRPPMFRPELPELGGLPAGYESVVSSSR